MSATKASTRTIKSYDVINDLNNGLQKRRFLHGSESDCRHIRGTDRTRSYLHDDTIKYAESAENISIMNL